VAGRKKEEKEITMFNIKRKIQQFIVKTVVEDIRNNGQILSVIEKHADVPPAGLILQRKKKQS